MRISVTGAVMERPPCGAHDLPEKVPVSDAEDMPAEDNGSSLYRWHVFDVPPAAAAVGDARRQVVQTLHRWGIDDASDAVDTLRLIVSELVTNAVRHAGAVTGVVSVTMVLGAHELRLGVRDGHSARPNARRVPLLACSGRGIGIVQSMLHEAGGSYGVEPHEDGGKTVWAELPLTSPDHSP
ncbi:ATP-binding protein [Streptomyces sp. NPDC050523]|uniref:ATP-binding protein n=1 Tax=Streptomyces sp. NPDC050523 TaxID=3365622 RepID=UPI00379B3ECD